MTAPRPLVAAAILAISLALPGVAAAQSAGLESRRQAVFAQLIAAPADRNLMLDYARLSVQLRDFEAAAATLERFLDLEPGNTGARVELAIAYFSLGAYAVAEYHLAAAAESGALTPEQAEQVASYQRESTRRDGPHRIDGRIALGQAWTREQDQTYRFGSAQLDWRFDMGGPNANDWRTQLSFASYLPGEQSFDERQVARLRTGPEFRLTGDVHGPRLQPYLEVTALREENSFASPFDGDYTAVALGLAYQNPVNRFWTVYADLQAGQTTDREAFTSDFDFREASLGAGYRPSRDTRIRGTLRWREESTDDGFDVTRTTQGLRLEALHTFDTGAEILPRRWELRAYALREFVDTDFGGGFTDETTDTAYGGGLRAFVTQDLFLEARGARLERQGGFGFEETETVYSLQIGWEF